MGLRIMICQTCVRYTTNSCAPSFEDQYAHHYSPYSAEWILPQAAASMECWLQWSIGSITSTRRYSIPYYHEQIDMTWPRLIMSCGMNVNPRHRRAIVIGAVPLSTVNRTLHNGARPPACCITRKEVRANVKKKRVITKIKLMSSLQAIYIIYWGFWPLYIGKYSRHVT